MSRIKSTAVGFSHRNMLIWLSQVQTMATLAFAGCSSTQSCLAQCSISGDRLDTPAPTSLSLDLTKVGSCHLIIRKISREERAENKLRLEQAIQGLSAGAVPMPSDDQIFVGDGPYFGIASEFLRYFVQIGGLRPHHHVLDIGSGIGRMVSGLSLYLDEKSAKYVGFDPVQDGVAWCQSAYAGRPGFSFHWADLYNELYNPAGRIRTEDYVFPCENASIDFAIATSIFTHLYENDIRAHLMQTARVLKPEGRLFATAYLYQGERPETKAPHIIAFDRQADDMASRWHIESKPPLSGVCFSESYFRGLVMGTIGRDPIIRKGRWQGGAGPWFQDLVFV
jgi:SAM-dependent methyltransferase